MKEFISSVTTQYDGVRILEYLKKPIGLSVSLIKKVKYGGVFINDTSVHMRATVNAGDTVRIVLPDDESEGIRQIDMPLDIVYEDEYLIAVNKPRNMPTHPSKGNSLPTLAEGIMAYFAPQKFVFRAINRLDRDTSGIVVIAKDAFTADLLSRELKSGGYVKKYVALLKGIPSPKSGLIDAPIEREEEGSIKRIVRSDGKRAITEYRFIKSIGENSLCEITLHTGRTHQIRVHMSHIGHPLVNDFLYGDRCGSETYRLHAKELEFTHPFSGKRLKLISKADFES